MKKRKDLVWSSKLFIWEMRKLYLTLIFLIYSLLGYSGGPTVCTLTSNNNCVDAISLTVDVICSDGCTQNATIEAGEVGDCMSGNQSIWYAFVATSISHQVNIWQDNSGGCFNSSAVWDGTGGCLPTSGDILSCHDAASGPTNQSHLLTTLTISNTYYIQVVYNSGGPCGNGADVCVEVITYDPCDLTICSDVCYAACEFTSSPATSDVTCCCPSNTYNPPMHERDRVECYTFTGNSPSVTFSAILSSDCGGGQFTKLDWTLYDASCTILEGPTSIFTDNTVTTVSGLSYTVCYDMTFAECNISEMWTYVIVGGVLPITLLYFRGENIDNMSYLEWVTVSETNNDFFTVERSQDGMIFDEICTIQGSGNSNEPLQYDCTDEYPYNGFNYYRLKQTDFDGQYSYSEIILVNIISNEIEKNVYYSITGQRINKNWDLLSTGVYIIYDGVNYIKRFKK